MHGSKSAWRDSAREFEKLEQYMQNILYWHALALAGTLTDSDD
jgi:hypothetical protein